MEALNCTHEDYQKAVGFSGLGKMAKALPWSREFFKIENGGMRLPGVHRSIPTHLEERFTSWNTMATSLSYGAKPEGRQNRASRGNDLGSGNAVGLLQPE